MKNKGKSMIYNKALSSFFLIATIKCLLMVRSKVLGLKMHYVGICRLQIEKLWWGQRSYVILVSLYYGNQGNLL